MTDATRGHGSPYDRGDADAYYWRYRPHKIVCGVCVEDLEPWEIREYEAGFDENPSDRKEWE